MLKLPKFMSFFIEDILVGTQQYQCRTLNQVRRLEVNATPTFYSYQRFSARLVQVSNGVI